MTTKLRYSQIASPSDGAFFSNDPNKPPLDAIRNRGRMMLGTAFDHNLRTYTPGQVNSSAWSERVSIAGVQSEKWSYLTNAATAAVVANLGVAISGLSRTALGEEALGGAWQVLVDGANGKRGWGFHGDAVRTVVGAGDASGAEINASQSAETSPSNAGITAFSHKGRTSYKSPVVGEVIPLRLATGSGFSPDTGRLFAADCYQNVGSNGAVAWAGIVFAHNSLMRENQVDEKVEPSPNDGYAKAIDMGYMQGITMRARDNNGTVGLHEESVRIYSTVESSEVRWGLTFGDAGINFRNRAASTNLLTLVSARNHDTGISINTSVLGGAPEIRPQGTNPNIALVLGPKGDDGFISLRNIKDFANDTAAAAGGIALNGLYRTGNNLKIRVA